MPINLSELKFSVQTQELLDAKKAIDNLGTSISNLNKITADETKAAIDNEKVKQQQAKTVEANAKAAKAEADAISAKEKATKVSTESTKENTSVLDRQKSILEFMTQGYSKGQSTVLAYAKANGTAANDIKQLGDVLEVQRKLMGASPFDKSMSGLVALKNQYGEVREAIRQYNADSGLTANQTRELARDKERIIEKLKQEGAGLSQIKQAIREYNSAYIDTAAKVNNLSKAEKDRERVMRETANATRNIQAAEERLFATVSHLGDVQSNNVKVNERAALALGSYERNLRLAGISGEEAAKKLAKFKAAQEQVSAAEAKNRASYVARGVGVQLGDVGVSLASGMNPLIVAVQQGDQLRSLIQQSGLEATQMAGIMQQAFKGIITSFKDVGVAMGSFVVGGIKSVGEGIYNLVNSFGTIDKMAMTVANTLVRLGADPLRVIDALEASTGKLKIAFSALGTIAVAAVAAIIGSSLAAIKEFNKLNQVIVLQGASMGLTTEAVYTQANAMQMLGVKQTDSIKVMSEMASVGNLTMSSIDMITQSAVKLRDSGGIAIEETVKVFSDLAKDPVKAVVDLNEKYNFLTSDIYLQIKALKDHGDTTAAAELAQKSYADMIDSRTKTMSENLGILTTGWRALTKAASNAWDSMLNIGREDPTEKVKRALATMQGKSYFEGGLAFGGKEEALAIIRLYEAQTESAKKQGEAQVKQNKAVEGTIALEKMAEEFADKRLKKQLEINKATEAYNKAGATPEATATYKKVLAGIEEKFKEKTTGDKTQSFYLTALEKISDLNIKATATTENLTKAEQLRIDLQASNRLDSKTNQQINDWNKLTEVQKANLLVRLEEAKTIELTNKAFENRNKLEKELASVKVDYQVKGVSILEEINNKTTLLKMSEEERVIYEAILNVEKERKTTLEKINELSANKARSGADILEAEAARVKAITQANEFFDQQRERVKQATQDQQEYARSFFAGWDSAYKSYIETTTNAATIGKQVFERMTDGMTDAIMKFVTTGKMGIKDFANTFLQEILRMQIKQASAQLIGASGIGGFISSILPFGSSTSASTGPSTAAGGGSWLGNTSGIKLNANANGNAFMSSGIVNKYANGGAFTNSIVSQPTPFMFANGARFGVMGEAGPEAILPLQRNSSGQLGVVSSGASTNVSVDIHNYTGANVKTEEVSDSRGGRKINVIIGELAAGEVNRPGSALNKSMRNGFGLSPALNGR